MTQFKVGETTAPGSDTVPVSKLSITPRKLFVTFSLLALTGFGGVLPVIYRSIVERNKWQTPSEFAELFSVSQVLPGATICNFSVMFGHKCAGARGAIAALGGLVLFPMMLLMVLGLAYEHYKELELVNKALGGMAVVAGALVVAMGFKLILAQPRGWFPMSLAALAFVGVGVLRLPLLAVLLGLGALAVSLAWWRLR